MHELLDRLSVLGSSKRLTQADQAIQTALSPFQALLPVKATEAEITEYEAPLLSLLKVNGGQLSAHFSIYVGVNLVALYRLEKSPRFWNLGGLAASSPTPAVIWAMGHVVSKIGQHSRSSLGTLAQSLSQSKESMIQPSLFTLRAIFKVSGDLLAKSAPASVQFAARFTSSPSEPILIAALRLLCVLVGQPGISPRKLVAEAEVALRTSRSRFAIEEAATLVALCATVPYIKSTTPAPAAGDDFTIHGETHAGKSPLVEPLAILKSIRRHLSVCFARFLDLLSPEFVFGHAKELVDFVLKVAPSEQSQVAAFFAQDVRSEMLEAAVDVLPFAILRTMVYDSHSARRLLPIALSKLGGEERTEAYLHFVELAASYPDVAEEILDAHDDASLVACAVILSVRPCRALDVKVSDNLNAMFALSAIYPKRDWLRSQVPKVVQSAQRMTNDDRNRRPFSISLELFSIALLACPDVPEFMTVVESFTPVLPFFANPGQLAFLRFAAQRAGELSSEILLQLCQTFLSKLANLGYSIAAVKRQLPHLMPSSEEPFRNADPPSVLSVFAVDDQVLANGICEHLPKLMANLTDIDLKRFLQAVVKSTNRLSISMLLLSVYQQLPTYIPPSFHKLLAKSLPVSQVRLQIVAECLSLVSDVQMKNSATALHWLVDASLARRTKMAGNALFDFLTRASIDVANSDVTNYVLYAIGELYEAKSMQLLQFSIGQQQCQFFLNFLNSAVHPSFTLLLALHAFERLLPILLPELSDNVVITFVHLIMSAFRFAPVPLARILFQKLYRAVIAFAPDLSRTFAIHFPKSKNAPVPLVLAAAGSLVDFAKINGLPDMFNLVPRLLALLQRTKSDRMSQFIVAIAKSTFRPDWFRFVKQILSANSNPGFGAATVEPTTFVKQCALRVLDALLPTLAGREPLQTECLDDLMTSTIRAIEASSDLHELAYGILGSVIGHFRTRRTEGQGRLLELYESQFSIASRYAFPTSVDVSFRFLIAYVDFYCDDFAHNKQSILGLLDDYVQGLQGVAEKTTGFFALCSKLCVLSRNFDEVFGRFRDFLAALAPSFSQLVLDSIDFRAVAADWMKISNYRAKMSPFYADLLPSFVWLQHLFPADPVLVTNVTMISFFLLEMTYSSEAWRIFAAFAALVSVIQYAGNVLDAPVFGSIVHACADASVKHAVLLRSLIPGFLHFAALQLERVGDDVDIWNDLFTILAANECDAETLARFLRHPRASERCADFAEFVLRELSGGTIGEDEAVSLLTVLFEIKEAIPLIARSVSRPVGFAMAVLSRAVLRCESEEVVRAATRFAVEHFTEGGMELMGKVLVRRPRLGIEMLARGGIGEVLKGVRRSAESAKTSMQFMALVLAKTAGERTRAEVAVQAARAAIWAIARWGGDRRLGRAVAGEAVRVVRDAERVHRGGMRRAFAETAAADRETCVAAMDGIVAAAKMAGSRLGLKKFSSQRILRKSRRPEEGEWRTLEIDD
jgi:hypothetical protein